MICSDLPALHPTPQCSVLRQCVFRVKWILPVDSVGLPRSPAAAGGQLALQRPHPSRLKEDKETLTLVLLTAWELMEASREPSTGRIGGAGPRGSSPLGIRWELVIP